MTQLACLRNFVFGGIPRIPGISLEYLEYSRHSSEIRRLEIGESPQIAALGILLVFLYLLRSNASRAAIHWQDALST